MDNYKRPKEEVDGLMNLAREKLTEFAKESSFIKKNDICVRVLGELHMLEPGLREAAIRVARSTRHHKSYVFPWREIYNTDDEGLS